jgi:hypothetical protein
MASVSFPFTRREKLNKVDGAIFEVLQVFVNPFQKLTAWLNMVRHIAIAVTHSPVWSAHSCGQR